MSDVYEILDRAYESEDMEEVAALTERALALDPDNPEALLLKADILEEDDERLPLLEKALQEVRRYFQEEGLSDEEEILEDGMGPVFVGLLQRMAYTFFSMEQDERALELVEELLRYDPEDQSLGKTLFYRILLEREEWARVLEETMKETVHSLAWAYARMIATFMLSKDKKNQGRNVPSSESLNRMLWDAVRLGPNVPFYILGYIPDPVDESEDEDFHFGMLFENVWPASDSSRAQELLNWFSKATILLGLLTNRFGRENDDMRELLSALGGDSDYEELSRRFKNSPQDDAAVLAALAEGNYPTAR